MDNLIHSVNPIRYATQKTNNAFSYQYYEPKKIILDKSLEEHLRISVCYWHTLSWINHHESMIRPNHSLLHTAELNTHNAFEFIDKLGISFFSFYDSDLIPESPNLKENHYNLHCISDLIQLLMAEKNIHLLSGSPDLFSHPRYRSGAATNPDPDIFSYAVAQVKLAFDITHKLKGSNFVIWNSCEGYETILNTDFKQEIQQFSRFLCMLVDYKNKIGFKGNLVIEPTSFESQHHKFDYDKSTIFYLLQKAGLESEYKMNIEANYSNLSSHKLPHEIAFAITNDLFSSLNFNQSNANTPWNPSQLSSHLSELVQVLYLILINGGLKNGGLNFDNKFRRRNVNLNELLISHSAAIDILAKAFILASNLVESKKIEDTISKRYSKWNSSLGKKILHSEMDFETLYTHQVPSS